MFQNSKCQKALAAITAFQMIDNEDYETFFVFHIKYISALATKMYLQCMHNSLIIINPHSDT